ncbi:hypothetical protein HMPREF9318_01229 [Streptococcus urinalis FB127-CNA-2]|uniref:Uncharacterized protein n=1 Tax=Streptococcus urinalis 2285-97 TaxID=764291 RepID=G5KC77_9STRE|nr:hypothetical protein [Streptococcus urinalis]EHJ55881.1 hypothetical protein STRUR_0391 [Streptococcus urinalis 2285-97]EKS19707.1 hypothetical protein HMPREF9318_01229 [Streptococcus urinalis FB127-CNA-2]VEF31284.1 Uncharacterised protein [Streptococcus urinalis]
MSVSKYVKISVAFLLSALFLWGGFSFGAKVRAEEKSHAISVESIKSYPKINAQTIFTNTKENGGFVKLQVFPTGSPVILEYSPGVTQSVE